MLTQCSDTSVVDLQLALVWPVDDDTVSWHILRLATSTSMARWCWTTSPPPFIQYPLGTNEMKMFLMIGWRLVQDNIFRNLVNIWLKNVKCSEKRGQRLYISSPPLPLISPPASPHTSPHLTSCLMTNYRLESKTRRVRKEKTEEEKRKQKFLNES